MTVESKKKRKVPVFAIYVTAAIIAVLLISAFIVSLQPSKDLYPAEIRNYQGEDLSSIANVRENTIRGLQFINESAYRLEITGLVDRNLSLTYSEIIEGYPSYRKIVTIHCVEGWQATILWEGVLVKELLQSAGVKDGAKVAIFYASDGYSTALRLDYLTSQNILLAYKINNLTIPPERGFPFELVAESQYGYKWIKWLNAIEVSDNEGYLGYWESRGYPNNATLR
jgi:DMSO/TMAO reductase YedYZ molybdopterin-dependent catalytic subunit